MTEVVLPDEPPYLDEPTWRVLLGVLVDAAETELGPEWRARLADVGEVTS